MSRDIAARVGDVQRLLAAARSVYARRARIASRIARSTGLSAEGVELGFASLERSATDADLHALVSSAGSAGHVHVVLSANVFVAPLRAIAIARAAADRVTVRASSRDPTLTHALVEAANDAAISVTQERDVAAVGAEEVHVYGRDAAIAAVRARARGTVVAHGPGLGIGIVSAAADTSDAARRLAADVVPFDQRGCLSPRIALIEGTEERARSFALALDDSLGAWGHRVPRGPLFGDEKAEAVRWREAMTFAGQVWCGPHHAVALVRPRVHPVVPPPGRHVLVVSEPTLAACAVRVAPAAPFVVAVGTDDVDRVAALAFSNARVSALGWMQHPPLDGPVDLRAKATSRTMR